MSLVNPVAEGKYDRAPARHDCPTRAEFLEPPPRLVERAPVAHRLARAYAAGSTGEDSELIADDRA